MKTAQVDEPLGHSPVFQNAQFSISVILPTYRRSEDLKRCLEALKNQKRSADEIIVVVRDSDEETLSFIQRFCKDNLPLHVVTISVVGQVAALNEGLNASTGDIIAITDDDTAPKVDWLERVEAHFLSDDQVGGVGGRDWVHSGGIIVDGMRKTVGQVQWFGRTIGNHHLGAGESREVDILKGANMSFRRAAIAGLRFDERLLGTGAQVHNDMAFCLAVRRRKWKLVYDPNVAVDHFPAQRFDEDQRNSFNALAVRNAVHNETLVILEHLPVMQRFAYILYMLLVGLKIAPGLLQLPRLILSRDRHAFGRYAATVAGRAEGIVTFLQRRKNS